MSAISAILQQHPDAGYWHQQMPWFSIGQLVNAVNKKETAEAKDAAQTAAIFFNDINRLHWLLNQPELTETEDELRMDVETPMEEPSKFFTSQLQTQDTAPENETEEEMPTPPIELTQQNRLSSSLAQAAAAFKTELEPDAALDYESVYQHTVDYFASQGILLENELAKEDKFGRQLRTFTSWLGQMKRLPDKPMNPTREADPEVDMQAEHSLLKTEILTEPMADVLLKQGKKQAAIHIFEKLRLLHPEKSLYFAARIEKINLS